MLFYASAKMPMVYVTRGPWKQQILVSCFKWVWFGHAQSDDKQWISFISRMGLVMKLVFCMWQEINRSNKFIFSPFKWICWDVVKVIQDNKLDFLHISRLQQKKIIAGVFSKILVEGLKVFCLQLTFMVTNCKSL